MFVILFAEKFVVLVIEFLDFYRCFCIEAPLCTIIFIIIEHVFKSKFSYLS